MKYVICAVGVLVLVSCGSNSGSPAAPTPTPTRTLVKSGTYRVPPNRGTGVNFSTTSAGRVNIISSWGSASNQIQVRVARGPTCGAPEYTRGTCQWLHSDLSTTATPSKTRTVASLPADQYIFWGFLSGSTDEMVTYEVYLTTP